MKIDRSFVVGLREGREDVAIVRAIVDLGRGGTCSRPMPTGELLP